MAVRPGRQHRGRSFFSSLLPATYRRVFARKKRVVLTAVSTAPCSYRKGPQHHRRSKIFWKKIRKETKKNALEDNKTLCLLIFILILFLWSVEDRSPRTHRPYVRWWIYIVHGIIDRRRPGFSEINYVFSMCWPRFLLTLLRVPRDDNNLNTEKL